MFQEFSKRVHSLSMEFNLHNFLLCILRYGLILDYSLKNDYNNGKCSRLNDYKEKMEEKSYEKKKMEKSYLGNVMLYFMFACFDTRYSG